jgi:hypothetical protein
MTYDGQLSFLREPGTIPVVAATDATFEARFEVEVATVRTDELPDLPDTPFDVL